MKILHITSKMPYPLTDGARICMFNTISGLASLGHKVFLVPVDSSDSQLGPLEKFSVVTRIPLRRVSTYVGALRTIFLSRPFTQWKRDVAIGYEILDSLQTKESFDAVIVDEIHAAHYGEYMKRVHGLPYLLRAHNLEFEIYDRHARAVSNPLMRMYIALQGKRWRRFEVQQFGKADVVAAISNRDCDNIIELTPKVNVRTIAAGVDLVRFPFHGTHSRGDNKLLILGSMEWAPNRDGALWFVNEVLTHIVGAIPSVTVHFVGGGPAIEIPNALIPNVRIEGRVPDIQPFFRDSTVGIIPLLVGGGMRVKMIEMMASGLPLVSTSQGAEGNLAEVGKHYLCADDPVGFASKTVQLLRDKDLQKRLSSSAYEFTVEHYSMGGVNSKLDTLLQKIVHKGKAEPKPA